MSISDDRDHAKCWIITNHLSRRNLAPGQITDLIAIKYKLEKKESGVRGPEKVGQNDPAFSTAEKISREHGVSPATVERAEKFAESVDKLPPQERKKEGQIRPAYVQKDACFFI